MSAISLCTRVPLVASGAARLRLTPGEVVALPASAGGIEIVVDSGAIWITRSNDASDYVLGATGRFRSSSRDKLVIESLGDAEIRIREVADHAHFPPKVA